MSTQYASFVRPGAIDPFKPFPPMDTLREKAKNLLLVEWPEQPASIYQLAWELRHELSLTLHRSNIGRYTAIMDKYHGGELPITETVCRLHALFIGRLHALSREIRYRNLYNIW